MGESEFYLRGLAGVLSLLQYGCDGWPFSSFLFVAQTAIRRECRRVGFRTLLCHCRTDYLLKGVLGKADVGNGSHLPQLALRVY